MKKESALLGLLVISILIISSVSFVGADELSDGIIEAEEAFGEGYPEEYPSDVELRDACEQVGLRRDREYCSDTGVYVEQKTGGQYCDNHFECRSNICTGKECVRLNLIQKIINFFKALLGIKPKVGGIEDIDVTESADIGVEIPQETEEIEVMSGKGEPEEAPTQTADECKEITDINRKDACYHTAAIETNDTSLCEKITNGYMRYRCYRQITEKPAEVTPQPEEEVEPIEETEPVHECEKIADGQTKYECYTDLAIEGGDFSLCEKIDSSIFGNWCYRMVAIETENSSLCEKQTLSYYRADCYTEIAIKTNDSSLCEKITGFNDDILKDWCYSDVESS